MDGNFIVKGRIKIGKEGIKKHIKYSTAIIPHYLSIVKIESVDASPMFALFCETIHQSVVAFFFGCRNGFGLKEFYARKNK
jgi:hypothetical protein